MIRGGSCAISAAIPHVVVGVTPGSLVVFQQSREVNVYRSDVSRASVRYFRQGEAPCMAKVLHGRYKAGLLTGKYRGRGEGGREGAPCLSFGRRFLFTGCFCVVFRGGNILREAKRGKLGSDYLDVECDVTRYPEGVRPFHTHTIS